MKRFLTFLLAAALVLTCAFAMTACGEEETSRGGSEAESQAESKAESETEGTSSAETVSTPEEYVLAEGYKLYAGDDISFAYPEDWDLIDGVNPVMADANGNSINLMSELANQQNTQLYESLSNDTFMELMGSVFEAMGMEIGEYSVETKTNDRGVEIICCAYSLTYEGMQMNMQQFVILGEETHYTVTVTEVTEIDAVIDEVFKSITVA